MDPESDIDVATRYLALSGRIWTVRSITPHPERFVLMSPSMDGDREMIVDSAALVVDGADREQPLRRHHRGRSRECFARPRSA